jgi:uncharacterized GH25 family protein
LAIHLITMKRFYSKLSLMLAVIGLMSFAPDHFLLPESFYLHKGDKLNVHLITGDNFTQEGESKYNNAQTAKFTLYEGSKKTDLTKVVKEGALPVLNYNLVNSGLTLVEMNSKVVLNVVPRDEFLTYLTDQGFDNLSEKLKNTTKLNFTEKYSGYLKTLFTVDNPGGNIYEKTLSNDLEIILKQNPFKRNYGDDITAQVNFKGKPLKDCNVMVYIKTEAGNVHPQKMITDATGNIYLTLSRDGIYLLRAVNIAPSAGNDADYETWSTTYTFAFSNRNDMPNTYKEFGFGDKH